MLTEGVSAGGRLVARDAGAAEDPRVGVPSVSRRLESAVVHSG